MSYRVVLIDDHHFFRAGLRAVMAVDPDVEVVGEAGEARAALALVESVRPDMVLLDLSLPGSDGLTIAREILRAAERPKIVILTMHKGLDYVRQSFALGVSAYLLKDDPPETVLDCVHAVMRGEVRLSPNLPREALAVDLRPAPGGTLDRLSAREREVFRMIVSGYSSQRIAEELFISIKTVETHRSHINQKLGVHSTGEIVRLAAMRGLFPV